jgi:hypothetical protein
MINYYQYASFNSQKENHLSFSGENNLSKLRTLKSSISL